MKYLLGKMTAPRLHPIAGSPISLGTIHGILRVAFSLCTAERNTECITDSVGAHHPIDPVGSKTHGETVIASV